MQHSFFPDAAYDLHFDQTISRWDEAIPLGNGLCGALLWGPSEALRLSLDRGDIWDTSPCPEAGLDSFSYASMIRLASQGDAATLSHIFDTPYNRPLPSKLPAGKIILNFGEGKNVLSSLHLREAEAELRMDAVCLRCFLHAETKVGLLHVNLPPKDFSFQVENPPYGTASEKENTAHDSLNTSALSVLSYPPAQWIREDGRCSFVQEILPSFSYGIFCRWKQTDTGTEIAFYVGSSLDGADWCEQADFRLVQTLDMGYEAAKCTHVRWWNTFWNRSCLSLPDPLFEQNWILTQYFLGSASRKGCYPMPLQGLWTADDGSLPPWKGDYHHDLNTELTYYSYLKANHVEEGESFLDFLWNLRETAREFARWFYRADGICLPSVMSQTGAPLGGWAMYSLSPTNQIWLCQLFERHGHYTGDRIFLQEKVYPYLSETAAMILSLLEERDGQLYLPLSSSPEIHNNSIQAFLTPNSNYDLALMRYLFASLEQLAQELKNGEEEKWLEILHKLPELAVNEQNVLMLSPDENLLESHRHLAHAMAIHPLRLLPYEGERNKQIIDATIRDLEKLGTSAWCGYSFGWMAELYAVQHNGNGAAEQLRIFWENHCSQNGFHLNGDFKNRGSSDFKYRPFTLEGNFCAADALQEMLLQSENGNLDLFPAIPDAWQRAPVSFRNFRAEQGLLVSAALEHGMLVSLELKPAYDQTVLLAPIAGLESLLTAGDDTVSYENTPDGILLHLRSGVIYRFGE